MNEEEQKRFESDLHRFPPARLPEHLVARIFAAKPSVQSHPKPRLRQPAGLPRWIGVLRWLAPVTAAAVILLALVWRPAPPRTPAAAPIAPVAKGDGPALAVSVPVAHPQHESALRAGDVQVDQKLVSSYDAVAQLPSGEPVRFRVEKWRDQVILQDTNHGVIVAQTMPRLEVVPVRFETY